MHGLWGAAGLLGRRPVLWHLHIPSGRQRFCVCQRAISAAAQPIAAPAQPFASQPLSTTTQVASPAQPLPTATQVASPLTDHRGVPSTQASNRWRHDAKAGLLAGFCSRGAARITEPACRSTAVPRYLSSCARPCLTAAGRRMPPAAPRRPRHLSREAPEPETRTSGVGRPGGREGGRWLGPARGPPWASVQAPACHFCRREC